MLITANLPRYLWGEAAEAAVYLYNRTPHSALEFKTPFELKYQTKPNLDNIKTFGSIAYYKVKTHITKLDEQANAAVLIGYGNNQYRVFDLKINRPLWTR